MHFVGLHTRYDCLPSDHFHGSQDVTSTVFYQEFGEIMMRAPVIGLEFTRYLPIALVPFVLLQV